MNTRMWSTWAAVLTIAVLLASCAPMAQPTRAEVTRVVAAEVVVEAAPRGLSCVRW